MSDSGRPLEGLRVIEMGQLLAGPFTGTILAYFGAEVIKVEPPGGEGSGDSQQASRDEQDPLPRESGGGEGIFGCWRITAGRVDRSHRTRCVDGDCADDFEPR